MNYRHAFHAGNFADVFKHILQALILEHLGRKPAGFCVLDTHAGTGRYDLSGDAARRTGEAETGIGRLIRQAAGAPAPLAPYLNAVRALNGAEAELRWYPGSPWLSRSLLRAGDRLILAELHPEDARSLRRTFRGDARVAVHHMDGWTALKAHLPPPERRGLVLVNPPYEAPDEAERLLAGLCTAHRRWPAGILAFWYPIKERPWVWRLWEAVAATGIPRILAVELTVRQELDARRFNGSGMLVVNPPWTLEPTLRGLLPWLHGVLAQDGGGWTLEWLAPETPALAAAPPMSYLPG